MFPLLRFNQSHQMNPIPMYHLLKLMVTPEPPYPHLDAGIKEVKYSDWYQREYAPMRISEEDHHSPNFPLTYNFKLSVRALIELHLLDRKIQTIRRHRIWYVKERQTASGLWLIRLFFLLFIKWGLSRFRPSQNIGTPEEYYQSTSHAPIFNFLVSMWYGQTPTSYLSPFDRYNVPEGEERGKTTIWDDTCVEEVLPLDIMFYSKGALLINNFNKVLQCVWPGFTVSIGYITNNFNSRSKQTFWLNYKHVREGKSSG